MPGRGGAGPRGLRLRGEKLASAAAGRHVWGRLTHLTRQAVALRLPREGGAGKGTGASERTYGTAAPGPASCTHPWPAEAASPGPMGQRQPLAVVGRTAQLVVSIYSHLQLESHAELSETTHWIKKPPLVHAGNTPSGAGGLQSVVLRPGPTPPPVGPLARVQLP